MTRSRLEMAGSPTGLRRLLFRAPIALYRLGLGSLLGTRFLMLQHRGWKTGLTRSTVLEVVADRPDAFYVAAAWRGKAHWLKNILIDPKVRVYCGTQHFDTVARCIDSEQARSVLDTYATAHRRTFARLARFMLDDPGDSIEENVGRVASTVPLVELPKP